MIVSFTCERCRKTQSVAATRAGSDVLCRGCGKANRVPGQAPSPYRSSIGSSIGSAIGAPRPAQPGPQPPPLSPPPAVEGAVGGVVGSPVGGSAGGESEPPRSAAPAKGEVERRRPAPYKHDPFQRRPQAGAPISSGVGLTEQLATQTLALGIGSWVCMLVSPFALLCLQRTRAAAEQEGVPVPLRALVGGGIAVLTFFTGLMSTLIVVALVLAGRH
ncbi:MAG: hypothetical protein AB7N76_04765 [Planctomycetota bacterium]